MNVADISERLGLDATSYVENGADSFLGNGTIDQNGWFYSTEGMLQSKDVRRHINLIISLFSPLKPELKFIRNDSEINIFCYWVSESGQGGPTLSVKQLKGLADLETELQFDIY